MTDSTVRRMRMFPLSTVLFPEQSISLHVFEERYRVLVRECIDSDHEMGIVLIARGSEVGGGDERFAIGTVARLDSVMPFPDGRFGLEVRGVGRIRIHEWQDDDPYPVALVEPVEEVPIPSIDNESLGVALAAVRSARALYSELSDVPPLGNDLDLGDDLEVASFRLCGLVPFNALDRQQLLERDGAKERLLLLKDLCDELCLTLTRLLGESSTATEGE